jgi:hypothetical protein
MDKSDLSETVFIVGAGAEVDPWEPVIAAINDALKPAPAVTDSTGASWWLAQHVYHRRAFHSDYVSKKASEGKAGEMLASARARIDEIDRQLKQSINRHLLGACQDGRLTLQPQFLEIARQSSWGHRPRYLTTNWDPLLAAFVMSRRPGEEVTTGEVTMIHGACDGLLPRKLELFLPTEVQPDIHHDPEASDYFSRAIGSLWRAVAGAQQNLVLYGLSLDPHDAELCSKITLGLTETPSSCRIWIANLPKEEQRLRQRVQWLLPSGKNFQIEYLPVGQDAAGCS